MLERNSSPTGLMSHQMPRRLALSFAVALALGWSAIAVAAGDPTVPDNRLTPGAITTSDPAVVCHVGYSREHRGYESDRSAYDAMRKAVFAAYGVPWSEHNERELDHRVPLALGGADAIANLWPQPLPPTPWNAVLKGPVEPRRAFYFGADGGEGAVHHH